MKNINWTKKLTSRKFWLAVVGLITGIIIACNGTAETAETVGGLVMSAASIIAYIVGEGLADAGHINDPEENEEDDSK